MTWLVALSLVMLGPRGTTPAAPVADCGRSRGPTEGPARRRAAGRLSSRGSQTPAQHEPVDRLLQGPGPRARRHRSSGFRPPFVRGGGRMRPGVPGRSHTLLVDQSGSPVTRLDGQPNRGRQVLPACHLQTPTPRLRTLTGGPTPCPIRQCRRSTRRAVRREVRRATLRDPNMVPSLRCVIRRRESSVRWRGRRRLHRVHLCRFLDAEQPDSDEVEGLMNPSLTRRPPARATASRSRGATITAALPHPAGRAARERPGRRPRLIRLG